jgi:hypothetical protein
MLFPCRVRAVLLPCPFRSPAMPCRINSHMPCRAPVIFWQCSVLYESPRGSRKYPNCYSYSLTDRYASNNNLRGTPCGSQKKPNACKSPTSSLDGRCYFTHAMPCPSHAHAVALRSCFQDGMIMAWHKHGMACVNQTQPHCVNQMERHNLNP